MRLDSEHSSDLCVGFAVSHHKLLSLNSNSLLSFLYRSYSVSKVDQVAASISSGRRLGDRFWDEPSRRKLPPRTHPLLVAFLSLSPLILFSSSMLTREPIFRWPSPLLYLSQTCYQHHLLVQIR